MRSLVLLFMAFGLFVGLIPLVVDAIELAFFTPDVQYNGIYEPLRNVEMTRPYEQSLNQRFDIRSGGVFTRWSKALPIVGAGSGAAVGVLLHTFGVRLMRRPTVGRS